MEFENPACVKDMKNMRHECWVVEFGRTRWEDEGLDGHLLFTDEGVGGIDGCSYHYCAGLTAVYG